jgi:ubiquinone biosynthesis protein COQ4
MTQSAILAAPAPFSSAAKPAPRQASPFQFKPFTALNAMGKLIANKEDTAQVFVIMRALSGRSIPKGYLRLLGEPDGGRIALEAEELSKRLDDHDALRTLPEGSVGRTYLAFVEREDLSAEGLAEESRRGMDGDVDAAHPYAWYGRRMRDVHDIWHVLTGYNRDALGEACLVAFSYAQTRALGFGFIAFAAANELARHHLKGQPVRKAVWEAYQHGKHAAWLPGVDYPALLAMPLKAARAHLRIAPPETYLAVPEALRSEALLTKPGPSAGL